MLERLRKIGPGAMVAAAFIGPGTVTTATLSGAQYGYTLLWAVLFSVFATVILQEMAARLGIVGGTGLGQAIRQKSSRPLLRFLAGLLVIGAILIGNAAYEAGNFTGAVLGFSAILDTDRWTVNPLVPAIAMIAFLLLYSGKYKLIERFLILLVTVMGAVFLIAALFSNPDLAKIIRGLFMPVIPENAQLMVMGLIGTTVVPYNLFLHASAVGEKWSGTKHLPDARLDTFLSVVFGGVITAAILITSAVVLYPAESGINNAYDLAGQLRPVMGEAADWFIAIGFFAAGLSSSITAPLAAAFATSGMLGWSGNMSSSNFRAIWIFVLLSGLVFASWGFRPIKVILFAQVANGILLPVIAAFLLWTMNDRKIMSNFSNTRVQNLLGFFILGVAIMLGMKSVITVFW